MSALLSPAKPVRARFKVPGEGEYELQTDLPPVTSRQSSTPAQAPSQQTAPAKPSPGPFSGGPLGLSKLTKLSFAPATTINPELPAQPTPPPRPPSPASQSASSLFSFRKLTGIGLGKLSAITAEEEPGSAVTSVSTASRGEREDGAPRIPPRVAIPNMTRRESPEGTASNPAAAPLAGVLAYNTDDGLIFLDLASRTTLELPLQTVARATPSCYSLVARDGLRLVVGCVNGEVIYFSDAIAAAHAADARRARNTNGVGISVAASMASVVTAAANGPPVVIYNRDGTVHPSPVVAVKWVPGEVGSLRFISIHVDGIVVVHDANHRPPTASTVRATAPVAPSEADESVKAGEGRTDGGGEIAVADRERERSGLSSGSGGGSGGDGEKSNQSTASGPSHRRTGSSAMLAGALMGLGNAICTIGPHEILVTRHLRGKRGNPAAIVWQVGSATLTSCDFSPIFSNESNVLAVTGRDGFLRILDLHRDTAVMAFRSYFGALLCVAWSPDGKYLATGGEDDLVSIWCPEEERLIARLEGHTSWVSAVAWDASLCQAGRYRVGSVGQDAKLLLWDFALDVLHHRSPHRGSSGVMRVRRQRRESSGSGSGSGSYSGSGSGSGTGSSMANANGMMNGTTTTTTSTWKSGKLSRLRGHATGNSTGGGNSDVPDGATLVSTTAVVISAPSRADAPVVEPVVAHVAHGEPLTDVWFEEGGVFTADTAGGVKMWLRPPQHSVPELVLGKGHADFVSSRDGSGDAATAIGTLGRPSDLD